MLNKIQSALKYTDIYKQSVNLVYSGREAATYCGGVITILIFIISVLVFYQPTLDFAGFNKYNWIYRTDYKIYNGMELSDK